MDPRKNSHLCSVCLHSSIEVNKQRNAKWDLFVVSAYAPTDNPNPEWNVDISPPTVANITRELQLLKRNKAAGPDELSPTLFKDGGGALTIALTRPLALIWESEEIPSEWCSALIIPFYKKHERTSCENHRGISLVNVASKLFISIILRRLTNVREKQIRENQAGIRPGRGCIDRIFTLRQILEYRHTFRRPTILVFLDLKAAFDSVDRNTLWYCLSQKGVSIKFVNLSKSLYSQSRGCVRVYDSLSPEFTTKKGVRQGCPFSPFLFKFVMDSLLGSAFSLSPHSGVELLPGWTVSDLEHADDVVLLSEDPGSLRDLLCSSGKPASIFGIGFAPPRDKMMLQDWVGATSNLSIKGQFIERVDKFTYLSSCITPDGSVAEELSSRIQKARLAFSN